MPFGEKWQKILLNCRWGYKCTLCACMVCVSANMVSVARWQVSLPAKWVWKCCMHARQTRANLTVWVATYIHMHISYIYSCHNKWQHFGKFIWKKNTRSRNAFVKNKKKKHNVDKWELDCLSNLYCAGVYVRTRNGTKFCFDSSSLSQSCTHMH